MNLIFSILLWAVMPAFSSFEDSERSKKAFFDQLTQLCGQSFPGHVAFPEGNDATLKMTVKNCNEGEIRIPFQIGENQSRTWIISISEKGLLLKHDHRNEDGTPDERTDYGGWAHDAGTAFQQFFLADAYTGKLIPEGISNQWYMKIDIEKKEFTYYLERATGPRFMAVFDLSEAKWED